MRKDLELLVKNVKKGEARSISRLISLAEDDAELQREVVKKLYASTGKAHVIGITGAPGAGKSTLVDRLALALKKSRKKTAIIAVDPSSPFSGGAILGDRIRMAGTSEFSDIFIRSMASRGALGGLSHATLSGVYILDAAGYDYILVETVGVGQAEIDIARAADTCLVVLVPGMGDEVQSVKAGILEIADIFVVNKADREGTNNLERDLLSLINLIEYEKTDWRTAVVKTVATEDKGVKDLLQKLAEHRKWAAASKSARGKKIKIMEKTLIELAGDRVKLEILSQKANRLRRLAAECVAKKLDPYSAGLELLKAK